MLGNCCLLHIDIILPWHFLYLVYLCLCLHQGLFLSCEFDLFFFIIFIFGIINHIISLKQTRLFLLLLFIFENFIFFHSNLSLRVLLSFYLIFLLIELGVAYKKKRVTQWKKHKNPDSEDEAKQNYYKSLCESFEIKYLQELKKMTGF